MPGIHSKKHLESSLKGLEKGRKSPVRKTKRFKDNQSKKISEGLLKSEKFQSQDRSNRKHTEEAKAKIGKANSESQKGKRNSQHGTMWITHRKMKLHKKIPKVDLEQWLEKGWTKGRFDFDHYYKKVLNKLKYA